MFAEQRMPRTQRRARRRPCLPGGDRRFCATQSRQGGTGTLRRALGRPKHPETFHASCARDADSARTRGVRLVERLGAPAMGETMIAHARVASHSLALVQESRPHQRPDVASQNQLAQSSGPSWLSAAGMKDGARSRWCTPCFMKLLFVTCCAGARAIRTEEHEQVDQLRRPHPG